MSKSKTPRNKKGQQHGYWEVYYNGELGHKCFFHNGKRVGYEEWCDWNYNSKLKEKKYYI